ncbi:MAG: 1,4-dihydroxy-2-naphthoate octaprenyltransferase [Deltaproteobacteria bacterium]|nr:1,4-dihydroxy-2-naphthoate octaprenyltransferase [Deltaproteobacteria bacterium]
MSGSFAPAPDLRAWVFAMRPWSFTAAAVPVVFGVGLAALEGSWKPWLFVLTLIGGVALQAATNLHNTYGDYVSGVDTTASAVTCPQLVTGSFRPEAMYRAGWLALACAGLIGLVLTWASGPLVLLFGAVGALGGYCYTNGKMPYKYLGLGPLCVFLLMGPLMALPAYFIQTGRLDPAPALGSLGIACLVAAIMHANDIRDIAHDRAAGIRPLALPLGRRRAAWLFAGLTLGAFVLLGLNWAGGLLPWPCLVTLVLLPGLGSKLRRIHTPEYDFMDLEGWTAKFHFQFGLLLTAGLVAARLAA